MHTTTTLGGLFTEMAEPAGPRQEHPIVFVHGMWEGASVFRNYLRHFSALGYHSYAPYLRGYHEENPVPDIGKVKLEDYLDDVRGAIRELSSGGNVPILIGHSMGGLLVQKLATEFPLPIAVAVTPAAPRWILSLGTRELKETARRHWREILLGHPLELSFDEACALLLNNLSPEKQKRVYDEMRPASGRQTRDLLFPGLEVSAGELKCRLVVISAEKDHITPAATVKEVAAKYGTKATPLHYPEFAHMVMIEDGWERVADDVAGVL